MKILLQLEYKGQTTLFDIQHKKMNADIKILTDLKYCSTIEQTGQTTVFTSKLMQLRNECRYQHSYSVHLIVHHEEINQCTSFQ